MVSKEITIRDGFQDVLLFAIYSSVQEGGTLIFKGGTAIRKVYGSDRFSDDLDFNLNAEKLGVESSNYINKLREKVVAALTPLYNVKMYIHKNEQNQYNIDVEIANDGQKIKIKMEISTKKVYLEPLEKRVTTPQSTYFVSVMNVSEIFSEKIRAVYTRRHVDDIPRDIIDMNFLISKNCGFSKSLTNNKLSEVGHENFSMSTFIKRLNLIDEKMWDNDLSKVMYRVPELKESINSLIEFLTSESHLF
jgi:predicted nucleotidyltransferase component of viral defense system